MEKEYGRLKRAYGEMAFCWQETGAQEWHRRRLYIGDKGKTKEEEKRIRMEDSRTSVLVLCCSSGNNIGSGQ